jgi:CHAT domain
VAEMTIDEAGATLLELRQRLPELLGGKWERIGDDVDALLDRFERAADADERARILDALLEVLTPFHLLRDALVPVARAVEARRDAAPAPSLDAEFHFDLPGSALSRSDVAPEAAKVERTPHIDVDAAPPIAVGTRFTASVYVDREALRPGEEDGLLLLPDVPELRLRVWLVASDHFEVIGADSDVIVVRSDEDRSTTATFELECTQDAPGEQGLTAMFAYGGRPAGSVWRRLSAEPDARPAPTPATRAHVGARAADLVVTVLPDPDGDERHFFVAYDSPLAPDLARRVKWTLPRGTREVVAGYMDIFTSATPGGRKAALVGAGKALFRATPPEFQEAFWRLADRLETILVVSSEPYVPWELMIPARGTEVRRPLGVEYSVGRWVHEQQTAPGQVRPLTDCYVIAPAYPAPETLAYSRAEAEYIAGAFGGERIAPAYLQSINRMLDNRGMTLLHFICHGEDRPGGQMLKLDPADELFDVQLDGMDGVAKAVREREPFVFINACKVGRTTPALVRTGGFAAAFTRLGARCVIAPIWSVADDVAGVVARSFYEKLQANPDTPFAAIMRDIRARAYEGPDPEDSYAAYCFYGDPLAAQVAPLERTT